MKTILEIINALTSLGIVGFLIYFFIYYRKPMKSVLDAIGDTDSLKAGPLEYKRRKAINKVVKDIDILASKSASASISEPISASILDAAHHSLAVRIQQLKEENADLKTQLLGMTAIAGSLTQYTPEPRFKENLKRIFLFAQKQVTAIEPNAPILASSSELFNLINADKIGVSENIKVGVVGKAAVNASDEIPPEESQQSKP